jgi:hypothetical protein
VCAKVYERRPQELDQLAKEYTRVTRLQAEQQNKSVIEKKPSPGYSTKVDYMNEEQALVFISKWEYSQTSKRMAEFMKEVPKLKESGGWSESEISKQLKSFLI